MLVKPVVGNEREQFIIALREELQAENYNPYRGLSVDYHPCPPLHKAAKKAGISLDNFPWKTRMSFDEDGTVRATLGYDEPFEEL